jgi:hypothetical protein
LSTASKDEDRPGGKRWAEAASDVTSAELCGAWIALLFVLFDLSNFVGEVTLAGKGGIMDRNFTLAFSATEGLLFDVTIV